MQRAIALLIIALTVLEIGAKPYTRDRYSLDGDGKLSLEGIDIATTTINMCTRFHHIYL